ncbi:hypothetical protein RA307_15125 [Xanthobacteraceae bacterium Astr-EGSB]|uniref:hypothetical protein n=1 Tax=Astrobacterium formosum TaxID=3069710 RepID=UPI0027B5BC33|nr:hypothetical protein [Xanthobacteraceae bacterium Astr-EGSB]
MLVDTVCTLAGLERLIGPTDPERIRLQQAITSHDTPALFDFLMDAFSYQGISDAVAYTYMDEHGRVTWDDLERATTRPALCPKLDSYWRFEGCRFEKTSATCAQPDLMPSCPLPRHDLRNGRLNQTAYSLFFFIRDIADRDLITWIYDQIRAATVGNIRDRSARMVQSLIDPLRNITGVSDKVLSMTLSYLLTAAPPTKQEWVEIGTSMVAIDTLVHNFLIRTGILRRFDAQHPYGPACYRPEGCADIIRRIALRIDARQFTPQYPRFFPRFVQHAIWRYCAQGGLDICNSNNVPSRRPCENSACPLFTLCDRVCLIE